MSNTTLERFWNKVDKQGPNDCWEWQGGKTTGYGRFWTGEQDILAHRFSYELHHESIPDGICVLHTCDNRSCVNPAHLWLGTRTDNWHDMFQKDRHDFSGLQSFPKGERCPASKLTKNQVQEIRRKYKEGLANQYELADEYNVYQSTIGRIIRRKTWKHI